MSHKACDGSADPSIRACLNGLVLKKRLSLRLGKVRCKGRVPQGYLALALIVGKGL